MAGLWQQTQNSYNRTFHPQEMIDGLRTEEKINLKQIKDKDAFLID